MAIDSLNDFEVDWDKVRFYPDSPKPGTMCRMTKPTKIDGAAEPTSASLWGIHEKSAWMYAGKHVPFGTLVMYICPDFQTSRNSVTREFWSIVLWEERLWRTPRNDFEPLK